MSRALLQKAMAGLLLAALALLAALSGVWLRRQHPPRPAPQAQVVFLDITQGDCSLVRTVNGTTILLDAGSATSGPDVVRRLRRLHVRAIDLLVLTTPGNGSIGGVPAVLSAFPVHAVWDNAAGEPNEARQAALEAIRRRHIFARAAHRGDTIQVGASTFWTALWPPEQSGAARRDSLVCQLRFGTTRALFLGAAPLQTQDALVAALGETLGCSADCTDLVLQASAGQEAAPSAELLRCAAPTVVVLPVPIGSTPTLTTLHRLQAAGTEVWRTDTLGTVTVSTDGWASPILTGTHQTLLN